MIDFDINRLILPRSKLVTYIVACLLSAGGGNFPNPVIQVLVGGFLEKENAERYAAELAKRNIAVELAAP